MELKTASKMFCGCKNDPFHAPKPNVYTCPVCLGLPGALPVPNKKAVEWTIMLGLALNCKIQKFSKFDRKNYFYPDLPKGYQISQYDQPIARNGWLEIDNNVILASEARPGSVLDSDSGQARMTAKKRIRIHRVHLEEDTGKLLHSTVNGEKVSLIDFNRSGVPLVEIVTEPDIYSAEEAKTFLKKLHQIIQYLGISDADMEKGSMRLEPNISILKNQKSKIKNQNDNLKFKIKELPKYKVEVKNINSFNFVKKAIEYEIKRHIEILERGETPVQETRGWEEKKGVTLPQRRKEEAHDYRYFPEPDIPPMRFSDSQISEIRRQIPEMPNAKLARFIKDFGLPARDAERLTEDREIAEYFEDCIKYLVSSIKVKDLTAKVIANWILNKNIDIHKVSPEELLKSISTAKTVIAVDENELKEIVTKVVAENNKATSDYKSGKVGAIMFLVGMVMKRLQGKADASLVRKSLEKELE